MNPKEAQDAAFDARCRAALEGRAVDAPAAAESLFAAAEPTGNKATRFAVLALAFAGVAAWGLYRSDVPAPAIEEGPVTEVEAPKEVTVASPAEGGLVESEAAMPEAVASSPTPETEAAVMEASPGAEESNAPASMQVVEPEVAPAEVVRVSAAPVTEPKASPEPTDAVPVSPQDVSTEATETVEPVSSDPVPAPSEAPENPPTLTLPLTLPSGGGL